jgi:hypothetical protein
MKNVKIVLNFQPKLSTELASSQTKLNRLFISPRFHQKWQLIKLQQQNDVVFKFLGNIIISILIFHVFNENEFFSETSVGSIGAKPAQPSIYSLTSPPLRLKDPENSKHLLKHLAL